MANGDWHLRGEGLRRRLEQADESYFTGLKKGTMRLLLFAPRVMDSQSPHRQDEIYIISSGSGWFVRDGERVEFSAGDALFVPAGMEHRFEEMSDNFETWVIFWGPDGGEAA